MSTPDGQTLEKREQENATLVVGPLALAPPPGESYWSYRVRLTETQSVIGFPKFATIGIGFAVEHYWNTNLPYTCGAQEIYEHIKHNAGDKGITAEVCLAAIRMIQDAVAEDRTEAAQS